MKVKLNYKGKEIMAEIADEELEKLVAEPKKKTGWEKVKNGEVEFYISALGLVCSDIRKDDSCNDTHRDKVSNNFNSEELTKNIARARALHDNMLRRSVELCGKLDWNNTLQPKYFVWYDYASKDFYFGTMYTTRDYCQIYFDTREHAEQVAEEFRDELIWYFTEFKERMD